MTGGFDFNPGGFLLSHLPWRGVPSMYIGYTSVFGMEQVCQVTLQRRTFGEPRVDLTENERQMWTSANGYRNITTVSSPDPPAQAKSKAKDFIKSALNFI